MGVRLSVFGSKSERRHFERLQRVWGSRYQLYHNLPFFNVYTPDDLFDPETAKPFQLEGRDLQRLKKTSIDFVLCDGEDRPLVSIDFDGLCEGYSANGRYVRRKTSPRAEWRDLIMGLKLRVGHASAFGRPDAVPYLIVGSRELNDLSRRARLTIVDGIIGEVLASRACQEYFSKGFEPEYVGLSQEEFDALPDLEKSEQIGDWVMANEIAFEAEYSKLFLANARLRGMLQERGVFESGHRIDHVLDPPLREEATSQERWTAFDRADRIGITYRLYYDRVLPGETLVRRFPPLIDQLFMESTVWLPNLTSMGVSVHLIGEEIGRMLSQVKLKERYSRLDLGTQVQVGGEG